MALAVIFTIFLEMTKIEIVFFFFLFFFFKPDCNIILVTKGRHSITCERDAHNDILCLHIQIREIFRNIFRLGLIHVSGLNV